MEKLVKAKAKSIEAPSKVLMCLEPGRAIVELALSSATVTHSLKNAPRGDGHPVMVLPGFLCGDQIMSMLRRRLENLGYAAHGWGLGTNLGPKDGLESKLLENVKTLRRQYKRKVSLVGWSLGGVFAREIAKKSPASVRQVITLGSPFTGDLTATNVTTLYELVSGQELDSLANAYRSLQTAPPVPTTTIFSRTDGIVAWECSTESCEGKKENIEVHGSHCGLPFNPAVLHAIADRLAQPARTWRPFRPHATVRHLYPRAR